MKLLQRYIIGELLKVFVILVSALTILLTFVGALQEIRESGIGPLQVLQILPWIVPSLLPFTIPATFLLTVCVVYGRLAGDQEITAAKAAGINVVSLLWPSFFLGAILSACSLIMTDQVIPLSVRKIQAAISNVMEDVFLDRLKTQGLITGWGRGLEINVMGVDGKTLLRPTVRYAPPGDEAIMVQAQRGNVEFDLDQQLVILHLDQVHADIPGSGHVWLAHEDYSFPLPNTGKRTKARHLSVRAIREQSASLKERRDYYEEWLAAETAAALALGDFARFYSDDFRHIRYELIHDGMERARYRTELHSRFALASSCFFFVLLGSPFSILQGRRQFLTNFLLVFLPILLCYYPIVLLMMNLSKTGTVDPAYAMWIGNVVLLSASWFVLRRVFKH